jgi:hypothetical protein
MSDDMKNRLREIRQTREVPAKKTTPAPSAPPDSEEESDSVGGERPFLRTAGRWPEVSLRLRFKDGRHHALVYVMLQDLDYKPDGELVLEYAHCRVRIRGRALLPLFDWLADHRVRYVQELDELAAEAVPEGEPAVTAIIIEELASEGAGGAVRENARA